MRFVDAERAEITCRKVQVALVKGRYSEALRVLQDDIEEYQKETTTSDLAEYTFKADVPLSLSKQIEPEVLTHLENQNIIYYGQIRDLTDQDILAIEGISKRRAVNVKNVREELSSRWKRAQRAKTKKKPREFGNLKEAIKRDIIRRKAEKEEARALKKAQEMLARTLPKS